MHIYLYIYKNNKDNNNKTQGLQSNFKGGGGGGVEKAQKR